MIRLTRHVERRILERKLDMAWIEAAIVSPDRTAADRDPALTHAYKAIQDYRNRVLKVVYRAAGNDILVVTAGFDRGATR